MKAFFHLIKLDSPVFNPGRVPSCFHSCFYFEQRRYKNKCGGDLSKSPIANLFEISPPNMVHNIDDLTS